MRGLPSPKLISNLTPLTVPCGLLVAFLASQYADTFEIPFINEDYAFLDMTRGITALELWREPGLTIGPWFRPLSQGFHYWLLQHVFHANVAAWHLVNAAIVLLILLSYFAMVRRLAGWSPAGVAVAGVATHPGWGTLVAWIAGIQDLWMLASLLLAFHLIVRDRQGWATLFLLLALASKETALVFPGLALAWQLVIQRRRLADAVGRTWLLGAAAGFWLLVHPTLGVRRWFHADEISAPAFAPLSTATRLLLTLVNLDAPIRPEHGWARPLAIGILGSLSLGGLIAWGRRRGQRPVFDAAHAPSRATGPTGPLSLAQVVGLGACWTGLGWLPLGMPTLGWHAYYALFGLLGAWVAIAAVLERVPRLAPIVIVILCLLRAGRAMTPSQDWGEESYVRRAGEFLTFMRSDLLTKQPNPKPYSRFYFDAVPSGVGFLISDGPALRVWYDDSTLAGGFYRDFRRRERDLPPSDDRFFRYDSTGGWAEVVVGDEDIAQARRLNPRWAVDQELVALTLGLGGDSRLAEAQYSKLAAVFPDSAVYPHYAALMAMDRGDSIGAKRWQAVAEEIRERLRLRPPP